MNMPDRKRILLSNIYHYSTGFVRHWHGGWSRNGLRKLARISKSWFYLFQ